MYASDIINRNRSASLYQNFLQKQSEFNSGKSIRIPRQSGGIDYNYMTDLLEGVIQDTSYRVSVPISLTLTNSTLSTSTNGLSNLDLSTYFEYGAAVPGTIDDTDIPISTGGTDFYFFGINAGLTNKIWWNTNNSLKFNVALNPQKSSFSATTGPAILLGQYDRRLTSLYTTSYTSRRFAITKLIVNFDNYYVSPVNGTGSFMIRLIRELDGNNRQWVEVTMMNSPQSPGYSTQITTYPSGLVDSDGNTIDPTKISPYNISNGSQFLNPCGTQFGLSSPGSGSSFVFESDKYGEIWNFYNTCFLDIE